MKTNYIAQAVRCALLAGVATLLASPLAFSQEASGPVSQNQAQQSTQNENVELGKVTVTGTAIPRTNTETPAPVTVITAKQIKESGFTSISDVVRSIAADNSGTLPTSFGLAFAEGASGVALRGLTLNSTLVLIDGRRTVQYPLSDDGIRSFTDLNSIPLNAVERIEVLKDGASSLYGADAIAGVVNIILYPNYSGSEATAQVGTSQHGGGTTTRATIISGTGNLDQDKYNAYMSFEYEKDDAIQLSDRGFPNNTGDLTSVGGTDSNPGSATNLGFVGSNYGAVAPATDPSGNLLTGATQIGPWQPLRACGADSTQVTVAPSGSNFGGSDCEQNFAQMYGEAQPQVTRYGLDGRITLNINSATQLYTNVSYNETRDIWWGQGPSNIQVSSPQNTDTIALPPTLANGQLNPNDPFASKGEYALISYTFGDLYGAGNSITVNHNLRWVTDLNGAFNENWNYDAALTINPDWLDYTDYGSISYSQLISDINTGAYSFVDPASNSQAVRDALDPPATPNSWSDLDSLDFNVNGQLGVLPGGPLGVAFGTQWRYEAQYEPQWNPGQNLQGLTSITALGHRNVAAMFAELDAPVLNSLEIDLSGREDHYSDFGSAFSPKFGIKWSPIQQLALRGTYSRGFRAPSFAEDGSSSVIGFVPGFQLPASIIAAHNADNYVQPYSLGEYSIANPNIQPERSRNYTLGMVFQPISSLSGTLDYYNILKTNVIAGQNYIAILDDYFAGLPLPQGTYVTPDRPDPQFPTLLPRPSVVGVPYANENKLQTSGMDLEIKYILGFENGLNWTSDFSATKIFTFCETLAADGACVSMVGTEGPYNLSSGAGTPQYRANWSNSFNFGPATITGTFYYVSHIFMSIPDLTGEPDTCFSVNPNTGLNVPANCLVPSFTYFNLTGAYRLGSGWALTAGIMNAFDRKAPFDPINYAAVNFNPTYHQAGIVGRFYQLGVSVKF